MSARVLVVDDIEPNVKVLAAKLTSEYFDVITAYSGPEALEKVESEQPDIVLLDVMMPEMDGFEVCQRMKGNPRTAHIPVIMVTALSDAADRVRGLESGADDFLTKPANDTALLARVRSLVRLKMTIDQWLLREDTSKRLGGLAGLPELMSGSSEMGRLLVVEDNRIESDKIVGTLTEDRHSVMAFTSINEALERAKAEEFDVILVSLSLIEEDGLRLCSHLRSNESTRQTPILLIADQIALDRTVKGLELGANDYIVRPIDRNELVARTRSQVRRKRYQEKLVENYHANISMALTDSLTGLHNRRYLMAHLDRLAEKEGEGRRAALVMCDIDHFKSVNDTYGHDVGDEVLREFAKRLERHLRNFDLATRIGGEEFVIVLPSVDDETAITVAERLRWAIANEAVAVSTEIGSLAITASFGVTCTDLGEEAVEVVLKRADEALYDAKRAGRNRVCVRYLDKAGAPSTARETGDPLAVGSD